LVSHNDFQKGFKKLLDKNIQGFKFSESGTKHFKFKFPKRTPSEYILKVLIYD